MKPAVSTDELSQKASRYGGEEADPQSADGSSPRGHGELDRLIELVERLSRSNQKTRPCICHADPRMVAFEQRDAKLVLELLDSAADR